MDRDKSVYQHFKDTNYNQRFKNSNKKTFILKKAYRIKVKDGYIEVFEDTIYTISFKNIHKIYIHKDVEASINELLKLAKNVPVKFIDAYGYIIGGVYAK